MKKIMIQPGVVMVEICDEFLLVATREARDMVPYIQHINEASAFYWSMLEQDKTPAEMAKAASVKYHIPPEQAVVAVQMFLKQMYQKKYINITEENQV